MSITSVPQERGHEFLLSTALHSANGFLTSALIPGSSLSSGIGHGLAYGLFDYAFTSLLDGRMEGSEVMRVAKYALRVIGGLCFAAAALATLEPSLVTEDLIGYSLTLGFISAAIVPAAKEALLNARQL